MTHPADFLHSDFPAAQSCGLDITGPDRFLNRELSWLAFNWRVLEEVDNLNVPLLERLRFLSISATNLDEFYSVRVAGLRELARAGSITPGIDGRSIPEQLELIDSEARDLMSQQQSVLANLRKEMAEQDIQILTAAEAKEDHAYLLQYFLSHVFPVVSPLAIDPAHPFPFIPNAGFALALQLERKTDKRSLRALVPIPQQISRFVVLPGNGYRYLPLEELILMHLEQLSFTQPRRFDRDFKEWLGIIGMGELRHILRPGTATSRERGVLHEKPVATEGEAAIWPSGSCIAAIGLHHPGLG
ncbi:hypothetical protein N9767_02890, partial [Planktomarina temperata]|nr:hypothetical protein [Planktomarina temperata]